MQKLIERSIYLSTNEQNTLSSIYDSTSIIITTPLPHKSDQFDSRLRSLYDLQIVLRPAQFSLPFPEGPLFKKRYTLRVPY